MGFVPFEIEVDKPHCFDVHRSGDLCVCGCSSIRTSENYPDKGYCFSCSNKRKEFVDSIIGNLDIGPLSDIEVMILLPIEQMRTWMLKERLYFIIDSYFAKHDIYSGNFSEPYDKLDFLAHCYTEKLIASKHLLESVSLSNKLDDSELGKIINNLQIRYFDTLTEMFKKDLDLRNAVSNEYHRY